jgi:hypothetical protein
MDTKTDSSLAIIPGILEFIIVIVIALGGYKIITAKFRKQRSIMSAFASQNNWLFDGYRNLEDPMLLPPGWGLLGEKWRQIYRIEGRVADINFELYALGGLTSTMFRTAYGSATLGYRTVLRTKMPLKSVNLPLNIQTVFNESWYYVLLDGNARTATELRAIFLPLTIDGESSTNSLL